MFCSPFLILLDLSVAHALPVEDLPAPILAQAKAQSSSRSRSFLAGRALLLAACRHWFGADALPVLHLGEHGRPGFADPALPDFNLSHSGDTLVLAFGAAPIGVDLELVRERKSLPALMRRVLSDQEHAWLQHQADPLSQFYQLWTLREALVKASGRGLTGLPELQIEPESARVWSNEVPAGQVDLTRLAGHWLAFYQSGIALAGMGLRPTGWQWRPGSGFVVNHLDWGPQYRVGPRSSL